MAFSMMRFMPWPERSTRPALASACTSWRGLQEGGEGELKAPGVRLADGLGEEALLCSEEGAVIRAERVGVAEADVVLNAGAAGVRDGKGIDGDLEGVVEHLADLSLVREEHEAEIVRQGLPLLDEHNEVALFLLSQVVVFSGGAGHVGRMTKRVRGGKGSKSNSHQIRNGGWFAGKSRILGLCRWCERVKMGPIIN
jgi:hypothetical protein